MKKLIATFAALGIAAPAALAATTGPYLKVSPKQVLAGDSVHLFGLAPSRCAQGSRVTIYSNAFKHAAQHSYNGTPALWTKVGNNHNFSTHKTIYYAIQGSGKNKTYNIYARCGSPSSTNFGHAKLTVIGQGY